MSGRKTRLFEFAHARSGDKGNTADIGLFAYDTRGWRIIKERVTTEVVQAHFGLVASGPVERYELLNIQALKFVIHGALGGGALKSLRTDNLGKTFGAALLCMEIEVPEN